MTGVSVERAVSITCELFSLRHSDRFASRLVEALRGIAPFDVFAITGHIGETAPRLLFNNLETVTPRRVIDNFLSGTYLLDAVYTACRNGVASGLYRLNELAPDNYFSSDFYNSADFHPCVSDEAGSLAEEIVYLARLSDEVYVVLSLMRTNASSAFGEVEFASLKALERAVLETMKDHWAGLGAGTPELKDAGRPNALERAFSTFAVNVLSPREQTIVSLLLRGHSTLSAAHTLDIAEGTAKVHRKNIYEKLSISSQAQLFLMFCEHIIRHREG